MCYFGKWVYMGFGEQSPLEQPYQLESTGLWLRPHWREDRRMWYLVGHRVPTEGSEVKTCAVINCASWNPSLTKVFCDCTVS